MQRSIVYPGAIPLDSDVLGAQQNAMIGLGYALQATIGTGTYVDGLAGTQTTVPSLTINVGPGSVIAMETVDSTAYGSLGTNAAPLVKMGINLTATQFTLPAPGTSGQSINYLIEAEFLEQDGSALVLPYVNPSNPATPYAGPNNGGVAQNTVRAQTVGLQLKAGVAATTGTQQTPATDSGWIPLYVVTVNHGQTAITTAQITIAPGAPFLTNKIGQAAWSNTLYSDTGSANALAITMAPAPISTTAIIGVPFSVKVANTITGPSTININGSGALTITNPNGSALVPNQMAAGGTYSMVYDGTAVRLLSISGSSIPPVVVVSSATSLTLAQTGALISMGGSSTYTTTTPTPVGNNGLNYRVNNASTAAQTFSTPAGLFSGPNGNGTNSISIPSGATIFLIADGTNWVCSNLTVVGGYAALTTIQTALNGVAGFSMPVASDLNAASLGWNQYNNTTANTPASATYGVVLTNSSNGSATPATGNWVNQTAYDTAANIPYFRQNINNAGWSGWQKAASQNIATRRQIYTNSSTWTCPAGVTQIFVRGCAAGGGGGAATNGSSGGGGGGGGQSTAGTFYAVVPGTVYTVTIGSGGAGGISGSTAATAGGNTSMSGLFTWTGGGAGAQAGAGGSAGGAGAQAGQIGGNATIAFGGFGGWSLFGTGGSAGISNQSGQNAGGFGAGGGGGANTNGGGAGAPGFIEISF